MNKLATLTLIAAIALLTDSSIVLADVVNGSFETGSFTPGWTTLGDTSVQDGNFGIAPPEGTYQAVLQTSQNTTGATASNLESFLGLTTGTLTNMGATEGSAIQQTIFAEAGSTLSFKWNFLTDQYPGDPTNNDFGFFTLSNNLTTLANTETPNVQSLYSSFARETEYQSFTYTITATNNYTLGFGVVDVGDTAVNSGLLVDDVQITPVPEPMTILGSFAVVGLTAAFNKKRNTKYELQKIAL